MSRTASTRIVIVDERPAMRAGLRAALRCEPGLTPVGEAAGEDEFWPAAQRARPDVVLLDYHLQRGDGLQLCYSITSEVHAPHVLLYAAHATPSLGIPARIAGAAGLLGEAIPAHQLFDVIRRVARGEAALPPLPRAEVDVARLRLEADDHRLMDLRLDRTPVAEIAGALAISPERVHRRVRRMLHELRLGIPSAV
jgi:DNA-binding NarL/FixJ family response regulator